MAATIGAADDGGSVGDSTGGERMKLLCSLGWHILPRPLQIHHRRGAVRLGVLARRGAARPPFPPIRSCGDNFWWRRLPPPPVAQPPSPLMAWPPSWSAWGTAAGAGRRPCAGRGRWPGTGAGAGGGGRPGSRWRLPPGSTENHVAAGSKQMQASAGPLSRCLWTGARATVLLRLLRDLLARRRHTTALDSCRCPPGGAWFLAAIQTSRFTSSRPYCHGLEGLEID